MLTQVILEILSSYQKYWVAVKLKKTKKNEK